ncbi:MAG: hypothetical protein HXL13_02950 [Candidatus Nanosynbacter sp.]|nr:hypothetical protein [Candidatus Nanosynbacter sp.]
MQNNPESNKSVNREYKSSNEWEDVAKLAKESWNKESDHATDYAADFYRAALDVTRDFDRRRQALESEDQKMSKTEFEKWEDALSDELEFAGDELEKTDNTLETMAECAQYMILTTDEEKTYKTIEAQAGNYYHERSAALKQAIESSGQSESKQDLDSIRKFYYAVVDHLDYRYPMPGEVERRGYEEFEKERTLSHNNLIKAFNDINDLARKYHVRPFTIRNFCPSDAREKKDQTPAVARLMKYDRYVLQSFYIAAFSSEEQQRKAKQERENRLGIY